MESDNDPNWSDHEKDADMEPSNEADAEDDVLSEFDSESLRLLEVVGEGDEDELRRLLGEGADLGTKNRDGQTALHLAVVKDHESMVQGSIVAAEVGNLLLVKLLPRFSADVESFNEQTGFTAFYQALVNGHPEVAKVLLGHGADIDPTTPDGHTPLSNAVIHGDLDIVEFLLENGANKYIRGDNGQSVEDLAKEGTAMMELLRSDPLLQGPIDRKKKEQTGGSIYSVGPFH
ncbi:hypothetical protein AJ79_07102 [Helicocarpus griseus UAMH5409]|uniref:Uncharacterized protein n=1 Tax=Helicocarpus griseus UAMH5409 TaxID=1447875 RepID=A0A2B7X670_9EURO|nr:hypothetical protein AJ79_07102 [Helicocarpus griseus UAMH5409]